MIHSPGPELAYLRMVQKGLFKIDKHQKVVVRKLDDLYVKLKNNNNDSQVKTLWSTFFKTKNQADNSSRGLYIYGSVGCGKTMLMDLFYDNVQLEKKKRIHFNSFMLDIHSRVHTVKSMAPRIRYYDKLAAPLDPLPVVAKAISAETSLLCFDEFQVTDVADAMILKNLFTCLFNEGVTVVATSNRHPNDLYKNGLQRSNFVPFIPILQNYCEVVHLRSNVDYRRLDWTSLEDLFFLTSDPLTNKKLDGIFLKLCNIEQEAGYNIEKKELHILGRTLVVQNACGGVASFSFEELCNQPLGPVDYIAVAKAFHTVIIRDIPSLTVHRKIEMKRFITMIDNFYDKKIRIICSAETHLDDIIQKNTLLESLPLDSNRLLMDDLNIKLGDQNSSSSLFSAEEEIFAADRTSSRLAEMQTEQYWNN